MWRRKEYHSRDAIGRQDERENARLYRDQGRNEMNIERRDRYHNDRDERERNDRNARKHNRQNDDRWESDARNHSRRGHSERDLRRTDRYEERASSQNPREWTFGGRSSNDRFNR